MLEREQTDTKYELVKEQTTVTPRVTVVMTSYNHEVYLSEAIESVLNQSFGDFELIIIDDASADNSKQIIKNYANQDPRIKAVYHSENQGIAETLNEALDSAKGQYIAIATSDDVWLCDKLEKQLEVLNRNDNFIVWSDTYIVDSKGKDTGLLWSERYKTSQKKTSGNIFFELLRGNFICPQTLILKKDIAERIGFDNKITYAVDYKFLINLAQQYDFHLIAEPLVKYRMHDSNTIRKRRDLWNKDMFRIFEGQIRRTDIHIPRKLRARLLSRIGRYLLSRKHYRLSRYYFWRAFKQDFLNFPHLWNLFRSYAKAKYDVSARVNH